jgi:hypothetical protein
MAWRQPLPRRIHRQFAVGGDSARRWNGLRGAATKGPRVPSRSWRGITSRWMGAQTVTGPLILLIPYFLLFALVLTSENNIP